MLEEDIDYSHYKTSSVTMVPAPVTMVTQELKDENYPELFIEAEVSVPVV